MYALEVDRFRVCRPNVVVHGGVPVDRGEGGAEQTARHSLCAGGLAQRERRDVGGRGLLLGGLVHAPAKQVKVADPILNSGKITPNCVPLA